MTGEALAQKALDIANKYKTLYVNGGWGQPLTAANKTRLINRWPYNQRAARKKLINAASADTFAFDCVNLIKAILWGWNGNTRLSDGGAKYASNGVPDVNADGMINICKNVSTKFSGTPAGSFLWMPGHCGVYIGDGMAVECTPAWKDRVQITVVGNMTGNADKKAIYPTRTWRKNGLLPFVSYENKQPLSSVDPLSAYTDEELAHLVILGQFGNGTARKQSLGTRYDAVQKIVNQMLKGA